MFEAGISEYASKDATHYTWLAFGVDCSVQVVSSFSSGFCFIGLGASRFLRGGECHGLGLCMSWALVGSIRWAYKTTVGAIKGREGDSYQHGTTEHKTASSSSSGFGLL